MSVNSALENNSSESVSVFELQPVLDIMHSKDLYEQVVKQLESAQKITLNASKVKRITTPCIQILLAGYEIAKKSLIEFEIIEASNEMKKTFGLLGLDKTEFYKSIK
jgi:anti-anti-sigma regulatory factor